jgi:hypothetical protein
MKELQSIYNNNIRIAKKFEELGFYKEADRFDNINFIVSQKIVLAEGPDQYVDLLRTVNQEFGKNLNDFNKQFGPKTPEQGFNAKSFLSGIGNAMKVLTKGKFSIPDSIIAGATKFNVVLSKIFGVGAIGYNLFRFFSQYTNDLSGQYGDSPKELALIVSNLAGVVSGIGMISAAGGGGAIAVSISLIAYAIQLAIDLYLSYAPQEWQPADESDVNKKPYLGGGNALVQDAFKVEFPEADKTYEQLKRGISPDVMDLLQKRILDIAKAQNIRGTDVTDAISIITGVHKLRNTRLKNDDVARELNLVQKKK